jgi:hypothetical protein
MVRSKRLRVYSADVFASDVASRLGLTCKTFQVGQYLLIIGRDHDGIVHVPEAFRGGLV